MASAREERMQQRLRGAQRRQVKNVDFGLSFPAAFAPSPQIPKLQKTPQPELAPQKSTRRTPGSRGRGRPPSTASAEESEERTIHPTSNANISAKRRKLASDDAPSSSSRSTRSSFHASRADIYALPEDQDQEPVGPDAVSGIIEGDTSLEQEDEPASSIPRVRMPRTPSLPPPLLEEITESPVDAPGSGRRMRFGIQVGASQNSQPEDTLPTDASPSLLGDTESPITHSKRKRGDTMKKQTPVTKRLRRASELRGDSEIGDFDELSPEQPKRGVRLSGQTEDFDELPPEQSNGGSQKVDSTLSTVNFDAEEEDISEDLSEEAVEINDREAAAILKNNRSRRISRNRPREESPNLGEVTWPTTSVSNQRTKSRKVSTPAQQRHPKKSKVKTKSTTSSKSLKVSTKPSRIRISNPIPVTVHRLTKKLYYDKDETDAGILNSDIPYTKRGGVNAIDVLNQICGEIIGSGLDTLEEGRLNTDDSYLRREYGTKWRAIDAFGKELQTRLLEHTINLDNSFALEKRVRNEQKKKLALRDDILQVRSEREKIALRMDEIRILHEKDSETAQERDTINTSIHNIELVVEHGKETHPYSADDHVEKAGVELLLKTVAEQVSNTGDSGGMLRQIKEFNAFLERTALALEGRVI